MKLNKIALALLVATPLPVVANAGVTVTPVMLGYHYSDLEKTNDEQRNVLRTGKNLTGNVPNGGVAKESGLYTGAAIGLELTPSIAVELEYGQSNTNGEASEKSAKDPLNRFDVKQIMYSANMLVNSDLITGNYSSAFKPYVLLGVGRSDIRVDAQQSYGPTTADTLAVKQGGTVKAGYKVAQSKDTIANLGLGAMYRVNDTLSLRGEGRAIYNTDNGWVEGLALAGLQVVLGGHLGPDIVAPPPVEPAPQVVPEAPKDSDGDGVNDGIDQCPNTPANVVVDERGCPQEVDMTENLKMELRVFFDINKSIIKDQYKPEIAKVADMMKQYPNATANIEGHASKTGPKKLNDRLSLARANAVKSMLVNEFGVAPSRMTTEGFGYNRPIAPNNTAEGRAMNRRVYAVITGSKTKTVEQTKDMVVE